MVRGHLLVAAATILPNAVGGDTIWHECFHGNLAGCARDYGPFISGLATFIVSSITAAVAISIFVMQRRYVRLSNAHTSEAQINSLFGTWNLELIKSEKLRQLKTEMIWSRYGFTDTEVQKIHFVYYTLNIMLMQWNLWRNHHDPEERRSFDDTMHALIGRMAEADRSFFITHFYELFGGFPQDFQGQVSWFLHAGPRDAAHYPDRLRR